MESLIKIKDEYSKLYPELEWRLDHIEKTNYSPSSDVILFEGDYLAQEFIEVQNYKGYREDIVSKHGPYQLHIYLYPIIEVYGEPTRNQNPTISKYFDHYPTASEIKRELQNTKSSWLGKIKQGGATKSTGTFKTLGSAKELEIIPKIAGHDMIAECDCGKKFSYQNSRKNTLWQCPECKKMKRIKTL